MKVQVINRGDRDSLKERSGDVQQLQRNLDPALHPFKKAQEYVRALNAAKLERVFAKPFIAALPHEEAIYSLARNTKRLNCVLAGCGDGIVKLWDVAGRRCLRRFPGHKREVKGVAVARTGSLAASCSADCTVQLLQLPYAAAAAGDIEADAAPAATLVGPSPFLGIDFNWQDNRFVTCGAAVDIWDTERSKPLRTIEWGADTVSSVRFNPAEPDVIGSTSNDRGVTLLDLRHNSPVRKLIMQTCSNSLSWNPMEPLNFVVASEDCNLYSYDMRRLNTAMCVHEDFTNAVMCVDFSPTGREFVAGSYDRSVRLFKYNGGHSHEVYTAKRMQRVFSCCFSGDATYVLTGSDDFNLRVWKAKAHEHLGQLLPREKHKHAYEEQLKQRYKHLPEVKRILRHRHLPTVIHKAMKTRTVQKDSQRRKKKNVIAHTPASKKAKLLKSARKKKIVSELE